MTDKRDLVEPIQNELGEVWNDVVASFDCPHSAVRWLSRSFEQFGGQTALDFLKGTEQQKQTVMAVLNRMDGIRIG